MKKKIKSYSSGIPKEISKNWMQIECRQFQKMEDLPCRSLSILAGLTSINDPLSAKKKNIFSKYIHIYYIIYILLDFFFKYKRVWTLLKFLYNNYYILLYYFKFDYFFSIILFLGNSIIIYI